MRHVLLLLVAGCGAVGPVYVEPYIEAGWCVPERPAYIAVSDALPQACQDAVVSAVAFWRAQGVEYLSPMAVPDSQLTPDHVWPRFIQVTAEQPEDPGALGECRLHRITHDCIDAAEIRLSTCRVQTVAHEIGHALGLPHNDNPANLMFWAADENYDGPYGLNLEQVEAVR